MVTLIDSNVILDVMNPIIFAEVSPQFELLEERDASLPELDFRREPHFPTVEIIAPE